MVGAAFILYNVNGSRVRRWKVMVPVFKEPYRETVEMGQTKLKHTGAQWNPVW